LNALLRRCRDYSLRYARINVVLGERMREELQRAGIAAEQIRVIENWAERDPESPKPAESSALRARLGLSGKFVVGYAGNLGRAHEFQTLLAAAQNLRGNAEILFLMIGGGAGMSRLVQAVQAQGLDNFRFLPYQPRECLADALAAADVHWVSLLPALEGFIVPSKFYGILAAARPVVFIGASDGELAREIRAGACGASVAVGDSGGLTRVLLELKSNPRRREQMGGNGYARYRERYCARRAFDQWTEILKPPGRVAGVSSPRPLRQ
jgi:glycosyltransferase involved in cell wall biosynthesis